MDLYGRGGEGGIAKDLCYFLNVQFDAIYWEEWKIGGEYLLRGIKGDIRHYLSKLMNRGVGFLNNQN